MKKLYISIYELEGTYDVEVYEWDEKSKQKGNLIDDLTDYALESKENVRLYIDDLKEEYEIIRVISYDEEQNEIKKELKNIKEKMYKPTYETYEFGISEFKEIVNNWIYKKFLYKVTLHERSYNSNIYELYVKEKDIPNWVYKSMCEFFGEKDGVYDFEITSTAIKSLLNTEHVDVFLHPTEFKILVQKRL